MPFSSSRRLRLVPVVFALLAALLFAPSAFARGGHHNNWGISVGFSGPGYSIGYSDCRHCGGGYVSGNFYGGYYGGYGNYYGGYSGGYYPVSYYPSYYDSYAYPSYGYGASYYTYPSYRHYRPVTRRVVRYDNYYYNDYHDDYRGRDRHRDNRRDDRRHDSRGYADRDRGYSRRASYYDRRD